MRQIALIKEMVAEASSSAVPVSKTVNGLTIQVARIKNTKQLRWRVNGAFTKRSALETLLKEVHAI